MTARDPIEYTGQWARRGMIHVPVVDDPPVGTTRQRRPSGAQHPAQPGRRATYRTTVCGCGCLLAIGEACPACGGTS